MAVDVLHGVKAGLLKWRIASRILCACRIPM